MQNDVRLIDANAVASGAEYLVEKIEREGVDTKGVSDPFTAKLDAWALKLAAKILRDETVAPTIDAVPVVHSSWGYRAYRGDARITVSGEVVCRKCHAPFFRIRGHWFKYCPNCGAKMDAKDMDVPTKDGGADK